MASVITHVQVDHADPGAVVVRWVVDGPPTRVHLATGPSPDAVDHERRRTLPAGVTEAILRCPEGSRTFVSVAACDGGAAVVAADRRVPFRGITNFRDLGGYRTPEGQVRWGRVFRSDGLHHLTEDDLEVYRALGIRSVFDLRSETERTEQPNPVESVGLSLAGPRRGSGGGGVALALATDGERILRDLYLDLLEHGADRIGAVIGALADDGRLPAVFHCHAGKDRTGVVAAVLLLALGVDREVVLDDYELTARYRLQSQQDVTFGRLVSMGLSREAAASVLAAPRWAMAATLDLLEEHGGAGPWLTGCAGLAEADLQRLRRNLLQVD